MPDIVPKTINFCPGGARAPATPRMAATTPGNPSALAGLFAKPSADVGSR